MFSRIFRQSLFNRIALVATFPLFYYTTIKCQDVFQTLRNKTQNQIVRFHLNGKIIGQGAVLKNGIIVTSSEIFEQQQTHISAQINGIQQNFKILKIEDGVAILQLDQYKGEFNLGNYEIGQDVYVFGVDEEGYNEYQTCPITDNNYSLNIKQVGEDVLNQLYPFFLINGCYSLPGSPVLNKKGELIGFIHEKIKNKTAIIPSEYFKGIQQTNQLQKPYLGCTLKTSDQGGAFIIKINSDSPADRAGLRLGEIIRKIDGIPIQHGKDVTKILGLVNNVDSHIFEIQRDSKIRNVTVSMNKQI